MNNDLKNLVIIKFKVSQLQDSTWQFPPENLQLFDNEVHLWGKYLDIPIEEVKELAKILAPDEQKRADRFRFPIHRKRFIVARATLRNILASYLDLDAKQIQFQYSDRGKPSLIDRNIKFNLSHSSDLAVYGFTNNRNIGVDLEYLKDMPDAENLAKRFFSNNEYQAISSLQPSYKQQAFFQIWTAKEAYLKATGVGLTGLDDVEIVCNSQEVKIASINRDIEAASNWYLSSFKIDRAYIAAIAVQLTQQAIDSSQNPNKSRSNLDAQFE